MQHESILNSVKKALGVPLEEDGFDSDILLYINSVLAILTELGVGPSGGVSITNAEDTWASIIEGDSEFELVKSYVILRVRLLFDPPSSSFVLESINKQIEEFGWRLNVQAEGAFDE